MHAQKWTAIALSCSLGKRIWSSGASWKEQCEIDAVQQKFISPQELPVCLASLAASVACSKTCLKNYSSLSEVGSRSLGWLALVRPPYPPLSTIWPGYFRQDAWILDETNLTLTGGDYFFFKRVLKKGEFWGIQVKLLSGKLCEENLGFEVLPWIAAKTSVPNEVSWQLIYISCLFCVSWSSQFCWRRKQKPDQITWKEKLFCKYVILFFF